MKKRSVQSADEHVGLAVLTLPRLRYEDALEVQQSLLAERLEDRIPDTLLLLEHDPVLTAGRATAPASVPSGRGLPVVAVTRGGDVTWHGPGQVVGYWLRKLEGRERDLHAHLRLIEQRLIEALAELGVTARRNPGLTGVWVGDRKIASIGVAVRSWVTWHGFALNVDVDPCVYGTHRPCGLDGAVMTDLNDAAGRRVDRRDVEGAIARAFTRGAIG